VQIVSFPEGGTTEGGHWWDSIPQSQLAAPVKAVLNVRTPGQGRRVVRDVAELAERFRGRVCSYRFVYGGCDDGVTPPLSWHLTAGEKSRLEETWTACPGRSGDDDADTYNWRARALVRHVLEGGQVGCTEIEETASQKLSR